MIYKSGNSRSSAVYLRIAALVMVMMLVVGCTGQRNAPDGGADQASPTAPATGAMPGMSATDHSGGGGAAQPTAGTLEIPETGSQLEPTVSFKLVTGVENGRMVFFGSGGNLDGATNPDLRVNVGDVVEIVLENGDGILHNVAVEGYNFKSEDVISIGSVTRMVFKVDQEGVYPYYCAIPGHRQAGMEGRLIVGGAAQATTVPDLPSVSLPPDEVPSPVTRTAPDRVAVELVTTEVQAKLADNSTYTFWTFNDTVPGPMLRVRAGDTLDVTLRNEASSQNAHSVDFHAATGPGGGAVYTQARPGETKTFSFKALSPGVYVYHCATPSVPHHISNGMYGLIVVEPEEGLPPVDREFYIMQGEIYTAEAFGQRGHLSFSDDKMLNEQPEYFIFNGSVGALSEEHPLRANVGETVRIFFGVGGPNFTSSFHVIGEIFDRVYNLGSLTDPPLTNVQSVIVPTGGSAVVEFTVDVPGRYILVDHSLSRSERGLVGHLEVEGPENPDIMDGENPVEE